VFFLIFLLGIREKIPLFFQRATHMKFSSKSVPRELSFKKMSCKFPIITSEVIFFSALDNLWGAETFDLMSLPFSESILGCTEARLPSTSLQTDSADCMSPYCIYIGRDLAPPQSGIVFSLIKMGLKQLL